MHCAALWSHPAPSLGGLSGRVLGPCPRRRLCVVLGEIVDRIAYALSVTYVTRSTNPQYQIHPRGSWKRRHLRGGAIGPIAGFSVHLKSWFPYGMFFFFVLFFSSSCMMGNGVISFFLYQALPWEISPSLGRRPSFFLGSLLAVALMTWLNTQLLFRRHCDLLAPQCQTQPRRGARGQLGGHEPPAPQSHCRPAVLEEMVYRPTYILDMYVGR